MSEGPVWDAPDESRQLALVCRQLDAVQRISTALYAVTDLDTLLRLALESAMEVVEADAGSLLLYDAEQEGLVFRQVLGPVAHTLLGTRLDLAATHPGIAVQVFRSGQSRLTSDAARDRDHTHRVDQITGYHTSSLLTVPLRTRGGPPLGVVQLVNKRSGRFDENDVAVIEILASLITMAVQNALLVEEAKLAAIARSVGEIGHDVGNMLSYVLPFVQSLAEPIADIRAGKPHALEALETFYEEVCDHVADGVQQVLARTKELADALKGEVSPLLFQRLRPWETARKVGYDLEFAAGRRGIVLEVVGDEALEAVFDRHRLYNALYNLVNNALPETPAGGHVVIQVEPDGDPDFYQVRVADTGGGMPEKVRALLFTDAAQSTKPGGTGLGTRIVRRIVEQHGGTPSVVSEPGRGTTITLRLPRIPPEARGE